MREANILYLVVSRFCAVDLHPSTVPNEQMGLIFENLILRFNELANETAGDHFTPREVIRLMVSILFIEDDELLATPGTVRKLLDPACGTGGMLAQAQNYLREHHDTAQLFVYGQDYNRRAFATAASDMLMKQVDHNGTETNVRYGDSLTEDAFAGETYDYFLTNPPFGVDWKKQRKELVQEHDKRGFDGRFGAGLPRVNDSSLLFLQHMWDKREPVRPAEHKHGSRLAIVFSGSPLFTGGAGSGESNIRKWLIENDWLEAIIALPEQMFYNTGIGTYIWFLTNRKERRRKGRIQLLDARSLWTAGGSEDSKRSLGDKRRHLTGSQIDAIVKLYGRQSGGETSKVFDNDDFGYTRVTVERPLRLRYRMTLDDKARFLDACPHLLDDVQAIDKALGREPQRDWNSVWHRIKDMLRSRKSRWKAAERKRFRSVFTQEDPEAEPVARGGRDDGCGPARCRERAAQGRHRRLLRTRGAPPRARRLDGPQQGQGRLRDQLQPPLLQVHAAAPAGGDRRGAEASGGGDHAVVAGGDGVSAASSAQWPTKRLRYLTFRSSFDNRRTRQADISEASFLPREAIAEQGQIDLSATRPIEEVQSGYSQFYDGDVVIAKITPCFENGKRALIRGTLGGVGFGTTELHVLTPGPDLDGRFLYYITVDPSFRQLGAASMTGAAGQQRVPEDFVRDFKVRTPQLPQQRAIADHLDRETAKLDALVAAIKGTIVLLKERRSALIAAAVTGQIDIRAASWATESHCPKGVRLQQQRRLPRPAGFSVW